VGSDWHFIQYNNKSKNICKTRYY